ncbi:MAG: CvpA family protein [Rhizobiales bacterium]|nr:CvpA family protein [Hyphomicrobiales bacterium]
MQFALLDILVVVVVAMSALLAMVRGFSREVLSVASWLAAAAAALAVAVWDDPLTPVVKTYIANNTIAMIVTISIVFILVLILVSMVTMRISDFIIDSSIGALDRTLGFLFGAARGVLLFVVVTGMFNWLVPEGQPEWIAQAKSKPFLDNLSKQLIASLPEDIESFVDIGKGIISGEEPPQPAPETDEKGPATIREEQRNELDRVIEGETKQQ